VAVPDDTTLEALADEAVTLGFITGSAAQNLAAWAIAWELGEAAVAGNFLTGTDCDVYDRPTGWLDYAENFGYLMLKRPHLVSVDSVTINHDLFDCACGTEDVTGCAVVYNSRLGIVRLESCQSPANCSCSTGRPGQVTICATSGLFNTLGDLPQTVKMALALLASWWLTVLSSGGADASSGFVDSWRSMDYSESLKFIESNVLGSSPQAAAAWQLLRRYRVKRAVAARGHYPTQGV